MQSDHRMREFVIALLKKELPPSYYFHDYEHTLYVVDKTIEIAKHEHCSEKEIELLGVAALWHDVGYIHVYKGHEEEGCRLVKKYLPDYGYSKEDIVIICGMIMATKIPQSPKTRLEEIIADADIEYLGAPQPAETAYKLFRELNALDPSLTEKKWNKTQISFLQQHRFFTNFCRTHREAAKAAYLKELLSQQDSI